MHSSNNLASFLKQAMDRLSCESSSNSNSDAGKNNDTKKMSLTPSQALVIVGLLGGALNVESVLVDRDQTVQIVLTGSLKQKTELEKTLDQIGSMPFDTVLKALVGRI